MYSDWKFNISEMFVSSHTEWGQVRMYRRAWQWLKLTADDTRLPAEIRVICGESHQLIYHHQELSNERELILRWRPEANRPNGEPTEMKIIHLGDTHSPLFRMEWLLSFSECESPGSQIKTSQQKHIIIYGCVCVWWGGGGGWYYILWNLIWRITQNEWNIISKWHENC